MMKCILSNTLRKQKQTVDRKKWFGGRKAATTPPPKWQRAAALQTTITLQTTAKTTHNALNTIPPHTQEARPDGTDEKRCTTMKVIVRGDAAACGCCFEGVVSIVSKNCLDFLEKLSRLSRLSRFSKIVSIVSNERIGTIETIFSRKSWGFCQFSHKFLIFDFFPSVHAGRSVCKKYPVRHADYSWFRCVVFSVLWMPKDRRVTGGSGHRKNLFESKAHLQ